VVEPEQIDECDALRSPELAFRPDPRSVRITVVNHETGNSRPRDLSDIHARLVGLVLHDAVPIDVRIHFETAKNLLLYSWFCYRFLQVAELHALGTLEMAFRRLYEIDDHADDAPGLAFLLRRALQEGRVRNEGVRHVERVMTTPQEPIQQARVDEDGVHAGGVLAPEVPDMSGYAEMLAKELPRHRNTLAHGSGLLHWGAYLTLELCCDIVNQLFAKS
jgi:hypothetical protein